MLSIKKITLLAAGAMLLGMTSCIKDNDVKSTQTYNVPTFAIATDAQGVATVSNGTVVNFQIDQINGKCVVKFSNLNLGGTPATLTTKSMSMVMGLYPMPGKIRTRFYLIEDANATGEGQAITDFKADLTLCSNTECDSLLNVLKPQLDMDPIVYPGQYRGTNWYTSIQFNTGDYKVMTFWNDLLYTGTSNVMVPSSLPYTDKTGVVRVKLALATAGAYKANVYFYNYKFNKDDQGHNFVVNDVPVTFNSEGFVINATDVTPVTLQDKKPVDEYKMSTLQVRSTNKMTGINCHFDLPDKSACSFSGIGIYEFSLSDFN